MKTNSRMARSLDARLSGVVMRDEVKARVLAELKGETPPMKKRLSAGLILALALLLLTAGIAVAASIGVFGRLAQNAAHDAPLLESLEKNAIQIGDTQTLPAQDGFPEITFTIDQAFYDGDAFYLSYLISGIRNKVEMGYAPTAEERAGFAALDPQMGLPDALEDLLPESGPWGAVIYQTYPSDGVFLESGEYLSPSVGNDETLENGALAAYYHFERPLPDEIQDQAGFTIRYRIYRGKTCYFSDGETIWYYTAGREEINLRPVTITRGQANSARDASARFTDYSVSASLSISQVDIRAEVTLTDIPPAWLTEWDSLEQMQNVDFILEYECWADGVKCGIVEGEGGAHNDTLRFIFTYSRPAEISELRLRPVYSNSGPRESEDLILMP